MGFPAPTGFDGHFHAWQDAYSKNFPHSNLGKRFTNRLSWICVWRSFDQELDALKIKTVQKETTHPRKYHKMLEMYTMQKPQKCGVKLKTTSYKAISVLFFSLLIQVFALWKPLASSSATKASN